MTKGPEMGARTNFHFKSRTGNDIVLYSHWGGGQKHQDLATALLKAKPRWDDYPYAIRITISQIIGEDWASETGYGLEINSCGEESYDTTTIDFEHRLVTVNGTDVGFEKYIEYHIGIPV
jgi:hypothetical protein